MAETPGLVPVCRRGSAAPREAPAAIQAARGHCSVPESHRLCVVLATLIFKKGTILKSNQ